MDRPYFSARLLCLNTSYVNRPVSSHVSHGHLVRTTTPSSRTIRLPSLVLPSQGTIHTRTNRTNDQSLHPRRNLSYTCHYLRDYRRQTTPSRQWTHRNHPLPIHFRRPWRRVRQVHRSQTRRIQESQVPWSHGRHCTRSIRSPRLRNH